MFNRLNKKILNLFFSSATLRSCAFLFFFLSLLPLFTSAQNNILNRISSAERSDGKGFVVRFHLEERVDSFNIIQPQPDIVQITIYSPRIDTSAVDIQGANPAYDEVSLYKIPPGIGVDVYIPQDIHLKGNVYRDGNSQDLLLGLTRTNREELERLSSDTAPVVWYKHTVSEESLLVGADPEFKAFTVSDNTYSRAKDKMKFDVVVIDAGHGGRDPGSIGYRGVKEKDVALRVAKKLGGYINEYLPDVKVVYTREDDSFIDLEERGSIGNRAQGDLFVSIHCNSVHTQSAYGSEVLILGMANTRAALEVMKRENSVLNLEDGPQKTELTEEDLVVYELANSGYMASSERLAGMLDYQFRERAQRRSRGVKQAGLVVLYHASMPAILVEVGFISNPSEARYLTSDYGQNIMASAIFRAIRDYKEQYELSQQLNSN